MNLFKSLLILLSLSANAQQQLPAEIIKDKEAGYADRIRFRFVKVEEITDPGIYSSTNEIEVRLYRDAEFSRSYPEFFVVGPYTSLALSNGIWTLTRLDPITFPIERTTDIVSDAVYKKLVSANVFDLPQQDSVELKCFTTHFSRYLLVYKIHDRYGLLEFNFDGTHCNPFPDIRKGYSDILSAFRKAIRLDQKLFRYTDSTSGFSIALPKTWNYKLTGNASGLILTASESFDRTRTCYSKRKCEVYRFPTNLTLDSVISEQIRILQVPSVNPWMGDIGDYKFNLGNVALLDDPVLSDYQFKEFSRVYNKDDRDYYYEEHHFTVVKGYCYDIVYYSKGDWGRHPCFSNNDELRFRIVTSLDVFDKSQNY